MNAPINSLKPATRPITPRGYGPKPSRRSVLLSKPGLPAESSTCGPALHISNYHDAKAVDLAATRRCLALLRHTAG